LRRLGFRTRLLLAFVLVVGIMATVATWAGFSFISRNMVKEAMLRVEMDLGAAWSAFEAERNQIQIVVGMASQSDTFRAALRPPRRLEGVGGELEAYRKKYKLDFLTLVDASGVAVARSRPPYAAGDRIWADPTVLRALKGTASSGTVVMPGSALDLEGEELAERAYTPLIFTERAVPTKRVAEDRGLVLEAAMPILDSADHVIGVLAGGVLLNRKFAFVDRIRDVVFGDKTYEGKPVGTVTLFLSDVRVATNVMLDPGTRAIGTRVSKAVYETVIQRGERFADRAFVVNDWYLSAYDPIRDPDNRVVGIFYVGLLEKKYMEFKSSLAARYVGISLGALLLSTAVALYLASGFRRPIHGLVRATRELSSGNLAARVRIGRASRETAELGEAFNSMAEALETRTNQLREASEALQKAYIEAEDKNRAYLEMLGFVTHELKSPLASIVFAVGSLRDHILGPLNDPQEQLLKAASNSADYLRDTIANYLNLSRIEEGELKLRWSQVAFRKEVIAPLLGRLSELAQDRGMRIECDVADDLDGACDPSLLTAVLQNLLSNAVKYGRQGGRIRITAERDESSGLLRFHVWNEGEGFPSGGGEKLFRKFSRLTHGGDDTKSGTGLGLFVSRVIVEKHGGHITAESEPGEWVDFSFTLPRTPPQADTPAPSG